MKLALGLCGLAVTALIAGCGSSNVTSTADVAAAATNASPVVSEQNMKDKFIKTEAEWKKELTPEQYRVLRQRGTERAFTGQYWNHHGKGAYRCAGCGLELFSSKTKIDSGCGWPSFFAPLSSNAVATAEDNSHSMRRTEVLCPRCSGHLGHVFDDGPKPTGLRYCINSAALKFELKK